MLEKYPQDVIERAKKIKLLLLDVDGVMTDGRLVYGNFGDQIKNYDVNDGLGIYLVKKAGLKCVILTAKACRTVLIRAKELRIDKVYHNYHHKIRAYGDIKRRFRVKDEEICFIGDDVIDIPVLKRVGLSVCPPNAMEEVKPSAHLVTGKQGGRGAIREVTNLILHAQEKWDKVTAEYYK